MVKTMTEDELAAFRNSCLDDPLVRDVWAEKYRFGNESCPDDSRRRVIAALYANDRTGMDEAMSFVRRGLLVPAGRIMAGAGTGRRVTLMNCYVGETIDDSMPGIQRSISRAALTMQQGGGIGTPWGTVRPRGALVGRTGSVSSGVIPFMQQQDAMCKTVVSAGARRGAMMATLPCDHPDLWNERQFDTVKDFYGEDILVEPSFISAKRQRGMLTQFNVSVLITDAFMRAVESDSMWDLGSFAPPANRSHVDVYEMPFPYDEVPVCADFIDSDICNSDICKRAKGSMQPWYVYRRVPARRIWEDIMRSTYTYAEPGVIFIDRVNEMNNLQYCEDIQCTNPCSEQPLPPHGTCCLGSVNMAFMVDKPFTGSAEFNYPLFDSVIRSGVRMLDNALDITAYPLIEQHEESISKRRIGLGITGFADACVQLNIRYGSAECVAFAKEAASRLRAASYAASSIDLAATRGAFPAYEVAPILRSYNVRALSEQTQEQIKRHGLRNGVLNTIAPNGSISVMVGNVASGHEPVYSFKPTTRRVKQPDGTAKEYESVNYALKLWQHITKDEPGSVTTRLPATFVGALDVTPMEHLQVHAAWSKEIDASVSKTINCPTSMRFEEFQKVYIDAFNMGCKGCTTYRYDESAGRGFVMQETPKDEDVATPPTPLIMEPAAPKTLGEMNFPIRHRPGVVLGYSHKLKWVNPDANWYINVTHDDDGPLEVFITTGDQSAQEWVVALSRMVTGVLRRGGDCKFIVEQLREVQSPRGGCWIDKVFYPSIVAAIGGVLEKEFERSTMEQAYNETTSAVAAEAGTPFTVLTGNEVWSCPPCPKCHAPAIVYEQGCKKCTACNYSECG